MTTYEPAWVVFTLDQVVPWGRSFDEYRRMFDLTVEDLGRTILGCGDGPACFNAEATRRGGRVVSCDPVYGFEKNQIQRRIATTYDLGKSAGRYVAAKLPVLPFPDATFDIALCSHFMLLCCPQTGNDLHPARARGRSERRWPRVLRPFTRSLTKKRPRRTQDRRGTRFSARSTAGARGRTGPAPCR